jgi:hypothetical protein
MAKFELRRLISTLNEHDVEFVVIGGVAVVAHGAPLATADLDICYSRQQENLQRLAWALHSLNARLRGAPEDVPFLLDDQTLARGDHFTFVTDAGDLDVIATPAGSAGFDQLATNATRADYGGGPILVASVEDLIRMKRASGRQKDEPALHWLQGIRDELENR